MCSLSVYSLFCILAVISAQLVSPTNDNGGGKQPESQPILRTKRQFGYGGWGGGWGRPWGGGWRRPWGGGYSGTWDGGFGGPWGGGYGVPWGGY